MAYKTCFAECTPEQTVNVPYRAYGTPWTKDQLSGMLRKISRFFNKTQLLILTLGILNSQHTETGQCNITNSRLAQDLQIGLRTLIYHAYLLEQICCGFFFYREYYRPIPFIRRRQYIVDWGVLFFIAREVMRKSTGDPLWGFFPNKAREVEDEYFRLIEERFSKEEIERMKSSMIPVGAKKYTSGSAVSDTKTTKIQTTKEDSEISTFLDENLNQDEVPVTHLTDELNLIPKTPSNSISFSDNTLRKDNVLKIEQFITSENEFSPDIEDQEDEITKEEILNAMGYNTDVIDDPEISEDEEIMSLDENDPNDPFDLSGLRDTPSQEPVEQHPTILDSLKTIDPKILEFTRERLSKAKEMMQEMEKDHALFPEIYKIEPLIDDEPEPKRRELTDEEHRKLLQEQKEKRIERRKEERRKLSLRDPKVRRQEYINRIEEINPLWEKVCIRESQDLETLKSRMHKNKHYDPFTCDTDVWNDEVHPEYAMMSESRRLEEFKDAAALWLGVSATFLDTGKDRWGRKRDQVEKGWRRADSVRANYDDYCAAQYNLYGENLRDNHFNSRYAISIWEEYMEQSYPRPDPPKKKVSDKPPADIDNCVDEMRDIILKSL